MDRLLRRCLLAMVALLALAGTAHVASAEPFDVEVPVTVTVEETEPGWPGDACFLSARAWAVCQVGELRVASSATLPWDAACGPDTAVPVRDLLPGSIGWLAMTHACHPAYVGFSASFAAACASSLQPTWCTRGACTMDSPTSSCQMGPLFWGFARP